jgi:hypothetical protein
MHPKSPKWLEDIADACAFILDQTAGRSLTDYENDLLVRSAVERQCEIIGEALLRIGRTDPATARGRSSTEYRGFLEGEDQGVPYKSDVTLIVSPPYLLLSHVRDAQNADHAITREIIALEEGAATDPHLTPS